LSIESRRYAWGGVVKNGCYDVKKAVEEEYKAI
jgi:hypothetical protein